jgi:hypothetical protein
MCDQTTFISYAASQTIVSSGSSPIDQILRPTINAMAHRRRAKREIRRGVPRQRILPIPRRSSIATINEMITPPPRL